MSRTDAILARLSKLHPKLIDLSLDRMLPLLEKMGNPQDRLPPTIHVAGTNAKGSTIAYLRAMLEAVGKRVHVYTSPHLVHFNERIRLAGKLVSTRRLNSALEEGVHVVGLSILSGSHEALIPQVMERMNAAGLKIPVVVGGIIPPDDEKALLKAGVKRVYTPKDYELNAIMRDIVKVVDADLANS